MKVFARHALFALALAASAGSACGPDEAAFLAEKRGRDDQDDGGDADRAYRRRGQGLCRDDGASSGNRSRDSREARCAASDPGAMTKPLLPVATELSRAGAAAIEGGWDEWNRS